MILHWHRFFLIQNLYSNRIYCQKKTKIFFSLTIVIVILSGFLFFNSKTSQAGEPDFFTYSLGAYDINDNKTAGEFRIEYRSDKRIKSMLPFIGLMITSDTGAYGYAGLGLDLFFGKKIVLTPSAAFGAYNDGDGKKLGGTIEFRTGAELALRLKDYSRIGIAFHHISNASIYDSNPGTESLVFSYSMPFTKRN
tara:strand:- start:840 stop:1421 length:582 start_codon:yes stop_codon:yes gene_type:complete